MCQCDVWQCGIFTGRLYLLYEWNDNCILYLTIHYDKHNNTLSYRYRHYSEETSVLAEYYEVNEKCVRGTYKL